MTRSRSVLSVLMSLFVLLSAGAAEAQQLVVQIYSERKLNFRQATLRVEEERSSGWMEVFRSSDCEDREQGLREGCFDQFGTAFISQGLIGFEERRRRVVVLSPGFEVGRGEFSYGYASVGLQPFAIGVHVWSERSGNSQNLIDTYYSVYNQNPYPIRFRYQTAMSAPGINIDEAVQNGLVRIWEVPAQTGMFWKETKIAPNWYSEGEICNSIALTDPWTVGWGYGEGKHCISSTTPSFGIAYPTTSKKTRRK